MTAGEVRKLLEGVPDEAPLLVLDRRAAHYRRWGGGLTLIRSTPAAECVGVWEAPTDYGHPSDRPIFAVLVWP